jgi:hypothetical protein
MAATYEPIATTTLGSAASSITFSSISSAYTDLRIVLTTTGMAASTYLGLYCNGDTAANYSNTWIKGDGASATSSSNSNSTYFVFAQTPSSTTIGSLSTIDIFSYAGSTYKTMLTTNSNDLNGSGGVTYGVALYRSTSAINSVTLRNNNTQNFNVGTTATIYGILKA